MENLVITLFIIPGFLFQNVIRPIQNIKESGNWSYLIPLVFWSSIFAFFAKLFNFLLKKVFPETFISHLDSFRLSVGNIPYFYTLIVASVFGFLLGMIILKGYFGFNKIIEKSQCEFVVRLFKRLRQFIQVILKFTFSNPSDDFIQMLYSLSGRLIIISLSSGKYYIGFLVNYSTDSSDDFKILSIAPIWSGSRKSGDDYCVCYDTYYGEKNHSRFENGNPLEMIIPFNQVNSISRFDKELNEYFISVGKSKFEIPEP